MGAKFEGQVKSGENLKLAVKGEGLVMPPVDADSAANLQRLWPECRPTYNDRGILTGITMAPSRDASVVLKIGYVNSEGRVFPISRYATLSSSESSYFPVDSTMNGTTKVKLIIVDENNNTSSPTYEFNFRRGKAA